VYLLLTRRFRAALVSFGAFALTVTVGFLLVPHDAWKFWGGAFLDPSRAGRLENAANQSLRGAFVRTLHSLDVQTLWLPTALAVGIVGVSLAAAAGRRGDDARGFSLCAITALLVSPVSWSHHWVLAVPALLLLGWSAVHSASSGVLLACVAVAAVGLSHVIWWVPVNQPPHSELHLDALQLIYADAYVLIAALVLALAVSSAARRAWERVRLLA
jgi:hypothetical protein